MEGFGALAAVSGNLKTCPAYIMANGALIDGAESCTASRRVRGGQICSLSRDWVDVCVTATRSADCVVGD